MMIIKKGKTNWQYLLILVFLVALVIGGILSFDKIQKITLSETKILSKSFITNDWKSYLSKEYGFELKYPRDWSDGPNLARPANPHRVFCPPELSDSEDDLGCKWDTQSSGFKSSAAPLAFFVEDWNKLKGKTKEEKKGTGWCQTEKKETINGIAMEFIVCDGQKRAYWEDPAGSHLYKLFLMNPDYLNEFNQMLSAFRFLK